MRVQLAHHNKPCQAARSVDRVTVSNRSNLSTVELGGLYHVATMNGLELYFRISMHNFFSWSIDRSTRGETFTLQRT